MFRHTFATEMLRSGITFPALMKLLVHSSPEMTMLYAEFTQTDLQREFRAARSQPRHLLPPPRTATTNTMGHDPDLSSTLHALQVTQHVLEMFRRTLSDSSCDSLQILDRKRQSNDIYAQAFFGAEVESWWHREGSIASTGVERKRIS
jgi:hypothetical protein